MVTLSSVERGRLAAEESRTWVKTPFMWQQCVKGPGGGCDCKMLAVGVARELGFPEAQSIYSAMADYGKGKPVPCHLLIEGLSAVFDPVRFERRDPYAPCPVPGELQAGDVLLLRMAGRPQHVAIVSEPGPEGRAVHAQIGPKDWVKETRLDVLLRAYPLHSIFRWRDEVVAVEDGVGRHGVNP